MTRPDEKFLRHTPTCKNPNCLHGQQIQLRSHNNLILTLRHEYDDQYVGVMEDGKDFIRESEVAFRDYPQPED